MKKKKVTIYVACHKKGKRITYCKPFLKYIEVGRHFHKKGFLRLNDATGDNISKKNNSYNELTALYWAWKNDVSSDIIGLCHYRRFFREPNCSDGLPSHRLMKPQTIEEILNENDIICVPCGFDVSCRERIASNQSALRTKDIPIVRAIIERLSGKEYSEAFDKILDRKWNYLLNMFISNRQIYSNYCRWLFQILGEFESAIDFNELAGQEKRIHGLWGEYLLNVFILANNLKVYDCQFLFFDSEKKNIKSLLFDSFSCLAKQSEKRNDKYKNETVLFRGSCDVSAILRFAKKTNNLIIECCEKGEYLNNVLDTSNSIYLMQAATDTKINSHFVEPLFYPREELFYGKYKYAIISLLSDGILGVYENKTDHSKIAYGLCNYDATKDNGDLYINGEAKNYGIPGITKKEYLSFSKEYEFKGRIDAAEAAQNLLIFVESIPKNTKIIILMASQRKEPNEMNPCLQKDGDVFYSKYNEEVKKRLECKENVAFVFPDDYYVRPKKQKDLYYYNFQSINHYPLRTYYKMLKRIEKLTNGAVKHSLLRYVYVNHARNK